MKKQSFPGFAMTLFLLVSAFSSLSLGTTAGMDKALPHLVGVWEGRHAEAQASGRVPMPLRLEFTRQEDLLLWAKDCWHPLDPQTGRTSTKWRRDLMLGSLNPDGTGGVLTKEGARFAFRLLDANRMEVEFVSFTGIGGFAPNAFYAVLVRGSHGAPPVGKRMPSLAGSWRGEYRYPTLTGSVKSEFQLDVIRQDGELLWVDDVWHPVDPASGRVMTENTNRDRMLGSLNADGTGGVLAKEGARFAFKLKGKEELEVEFVSASRTAEETTGFYAVLRKDGSHPYVEATRLPDLSGTWEGDYEYPQPKGINSYHFQLEIKKQDGPLLWADDIWHPVDPATGRLSPSIRRDPLIGSLNTEGKAGILAKPGARFGLTILDKDRMLVEFVRVRTEGQKPMAFYTVLTRKK